METTTDAAGNVTETITDVALMAPVAVVSTNQPDYKDLSIEWKNRSAGWQNKFQAEQEEKKNVQLALNSLQAKHATITENNLSLAEQIKLLKEKETSITTELGNKNSQLERLNMISSDFPNLIPFLKDNLLPDGSGDELREKLTVFSQKLQSMTTSSAKDLATEVSKGALPPPPAQTTSSDSLFSQAKAALVAGNNAEYERLMTEHYKQQKN